MFWINTSIGFHRVYQAGTNLDDIPLYAPLPKVGTESKERLNFAEYPKAPSLDESVDEVEYESYKVPVRIKILRHDPPYVVIDIRPESGAKLPKGITKLGGELAVFLSPASWPYADQNSWELGSPSMAE